MNLEFLKSIQKGTLRNNAQIIDEIKSIDLKSPNNINRMTELFCELLTKKSYAYFFNMIGPSQWLQDCLENKESNGLMTKISDDTEKYIFQLYEENYGSVRETILYLDSLKDPHAVPYLHVFIKNASGIIFKGSENCSTNEQIDLLFGNDKVLLRWCMDQIKNGFQLKHFGGQTNTKIGLYAQLFSQIPELKNYLNPQAQHNIDLGGGFATPEVSKLLSKDFISYDLIPPTAAQDWGISFAQTWGHSATQASFAMKESLHKQSFNFFDVFTHDFPSDFDSYNIVSFGFLNSTVTSLSAEQPTLPRGLKKFSTMYHAMYRIVKLAALGKNISILTYGRPDLAYMNRLVLGKFENQKATNITVPNHYLAFQPFAQPQFGGAKLSRKQLELLNLFD